MNKTQILVVEDEGIIAKDLQAMLKRLGYHVPTTVGTGDLAIQAAIQNQPDLILMDIQLRGAMDGVQAADAINSLQDVPIVYLTANSDASTFQRAKGTQPFGFLIKPFEERAIQAGIEMALYKHKTDKQIRDREQWLATTLKSIADAVITTDRQGNVTFLNAAAEILCGWTHVEALGRPYNEVFRILDGATPAVQIDRVSAALRNGEGGSFSSNTLLIKRDGSEIHIEHSVAPIRQGSQDEIGGCVIVFSDVSERKLLESQLRQAQKMDAIGKLAGGIAHDFNNAITAILGYAELILLGVEDGDQLYKDAKQIVKAAEHSAKLTHQLLAFSRKQVLQPRCLALGEEILEMEGMVRRLIGANIELLIESAADLWNTTADAGQVQQVVFNMAVNARDAMVAGGRLMIKLSNMTLGGPEALSIADGYPGEFVLLTIADTGAGMSEEVLKQIFEPFFTTKGPGKGTGLGLATCYGIVKQSAGMISVSSKLGVGTTFSIYLPKADASGPGVSRDPVNDELPVGTEAILIVEDEEILRELAVQVLESLGYTTFSAEDGVQAIEILSSEASRDIQLVITDLVMPRTNGREVIAWIEREFRPVRVLFMSGYTDDEILRHALTDAAVEFLQKPFTPKGLAQKVRGVLDRPLPAFCAIA